MGCVTALALASRGARVVLLEANAGGVSRRLGGEWLHPPGVHVLHRLGILSQEVAAQHSLPATPLPRDGGEGGLGFVLYSNGESIMLPYNNKGNGLVCEHGKFVSVLRTAAMSRPGVELRQGRVLEIKGQQVTYHSEERNSVVEIQADLIVGADGRSSIVRRSLGLPDDRRSVSQMAGVILDNVGLPHPGYGHIILGGLGPVFLFPISSTSVRVNMDIPLDRLAELRDPGRLFDAYAPQLPVPLHDGFRRALKSGPVVWAANQIRPRTSYGRKGLALVGDAAGFFHPLTAAGMTIGFLDGYALAESRSFREYYQRRLAQTFVPDMLASSLYKVFAATDAGAEALRAAVFRMLRENGRERRKTMQLLSGEDNRVSSFCGSFLNVMALAIRGLLGDRRCRRWRFASAVTCGLAAWLVWLAWMSSPLRNCWRHLGQPGSKPARSLSRNDQREPDLLRVQESTP